MYKLAIIDDEYEHVRGISEFIPWGQHDIEVCGVAYNGRDGLELLKNKAPEIAIIDIQMPFINGLSLIEEAKRLDVNTQMIIMSGHDNFEYARKAIELKANNYLLKPCSAEEVLQAVLKAKNLYIEESAKRQVLQQYQSVLIEKIISKVHSQGPVNKLIQRALNYIHHNYSKDISLKTVADELFLSPAYLSALFKQEMKTNFVDYLNHFRISMAKDLLKDVRFKSYEIAYQVGFQDEKYFFKLFKKYTGVTPSQYRENLSEFEIK